jgi:hypothetical protein
MPNLWHTREKILKDLVISLPLGELGIGNIE